MGQLVRRMKRDDAFKIYYGIVGNVSIEGIERIRETSFSVASETGCRAIDAYFFATAKITNSILITNDRIMVNNAKKYGIEAYYLIEEFDNAIDRLKRLRT